MDEILSATLRDAVYSRLDYLDTLVRNTDEASRASLADTEITRMTEAWRALLAAHEPDAYGRCRACSPRLLGRRTLCTVWRTAHRHLIADIAERRLLDGTPTGRHRLRRTRPDTQEC